MYIFSEEPSRRDKAELQLIRDLFTVRETFRKGPDRVIALDSIDWLLVETSSTLFLKALSAKAEVATPSGCLLYMQNFRSHFRPDSKLPQPPGWLRITLKFEMPTSRLGLRLEMLIKSLITTSYNFTHESVYILNCFTWGPRGPDVLVFGRLDRLYRIFEMCIVLLHSGFPGPTLGEFYSIYLSYSSWFSVAEE